MVYKIRRQLSVKVGHCGTLDPLASGLLILVLGKATKLSQYLLKAQKTYFLELQLGAQSNTLDSTGLVSYTDLQPFEKKWSISKCSASGVKGWGDLSYINENYNWIELLYTEIKKLSGNCQLEVPQYSAIKYKGRELYKYIRSGHEIPVKVFKDMCFSSIRLVDISWPKLSFVIECSSGSYIRTWVSVLGQRLKTQAILTKLRRIGSAPYSLLSALSLETLLRLDHLKIMETKSFILLKNMLPYLPRYSVGGFNAMLVQNGQVPHALKHRLESEKSHVVQIVDDVGGDILSILEKKDKIGWNPQVVFNEI